MIVAYIPDASRYSSMEYRRCGRSGLLLPAISLGLWHNFGEITPLSVQRQLLTTAFDHGITHFDIANNYGPPYGEAERSFGIHYARDWKALRDEIVVSTKAGYDMWQGPYGDHGSRKYLIASCDQSLRRTGLSYFDIFYHHRPDPDTPLEETMGALDAIVRSGRALYVGVSNYPAELAKKAQEILRGMGTPLLVDQVRYSLFSRSPEEALLPEAREAGFGITAFSPLAGGLLTGKYAGGIPADSRAARDPRYLKPENISQSDVEKAIRLGEIARQRGDTPSQLALRWVLRDDAVTSAVIGASRPEQILDNLGALSGSPLSPDEIRTMDAIVG